MIDRLLMAFFPPRSRTALWGALALALPVAILTVLAISTFGAAEQRIVTIFLINLIAVIGTGLYAGNTGIMSFGHVGFMGIGAYAASILTMPPTAKATALPNLPTFLATIDLGLPEATIVSMLLVGAFAFIIGVPISRLGGSAASITTLGFLVIVHSVLNGAKDFTRGSQTFYGVERLVTLPSLLAWVVLVIIVARVFRELPAGLQLRASREDELAASAMGVDIAKRRLLAWVVSAMIMAVAGAMIAHFLGAFSPKKFFFVDTFILLAMLIIGGVASVSGAVVGTAAVTLVMELARRIEEGPLLPMLGLPQLFGLTQLALGLGILLTMYWRPGGLLGLAEVDHWFLRPVPPPPAPPAPPRPTVPDERIAARAVSKRFSGLLALDSVDLELRPREIVGLIGPNGSGKTTLLNAVSGAVPPTAGAIHVDGTSVAGLASFRIARLGLGRSFQNIRLFKSLSVIENIEVAVTASGRTVQDSRREAMTALTELGLEALTFRQAGALAYGEQRRVEIARALALNPRYLMLDEPAAGMNSAETIGLIALLRLIRDKRGLGMLLVEHHLDLVMELCDRLVVLNKGQVIAAGTPTDVRNDPAVIEAYIGVRNK